MKKSINKTTVIIVLAVFLTLSVGYALFSDTITIEGTATAQGNFDIEVTCLTTIPDDLKNSSDGALASEMSGSPDAGFKDESCVVTDDKLVYSVGLEYPGAQKYYAVQFTNVGSIDAKLSYNSLIEQLDYEKIEIYDFSDKLISTNSQEIDFFWLAENTFHFKKHDGTFINTNNSTEEDMEYTVDFSDENNPSYVLRKGASMYIVFYVEWPTRDEYSQDGVYYKAKQTLEFPFEQYTK